jgi:hypothetical protein
MPDYDEMSIAQLERYRAKRTETISTARDEFHAAGVVLHRKLQEPDITAKKGQVVKLLGEIAAAEGKEVEEVLADG